MADNGAAAYVNGAKIADDLSANHEINPYNWNTIATIPAGTLVAGLNIIAVAVGCEASVGEGGGRALPEPTRPPVRMMNLGAWAPACAALA